MVTAKDSRTTDEWHGTSVDVPAIEAALNTLWQRWGQRAALDGQRPPVRTSVMNLVVYVDSEDGFALVRSAASNLSGRHPSRAICVVADDDVPSSTLDARVLSHCGDEDGQLGQLCWEQITIKARRDAATRLPGIVVPLLLPELPTYLWWVGDVPFGSAALRHLWDAADRLIVDSKYFARPIDAVRNLADLQRGVGAGRSLVDLNWIRLESWRQLAAQFFDPEDMRPYLQRIEAIDLDFAHDGDAPVNPTQALLLAGWMACCLEWSARPEAARWNADAIHLEADRTGSTVNVGIAPRPSAGVEQGDVLAYRIHATSPAIPGIFEIVRDGHGATAQTRMTLGGSDGAAHAVHMGAIAINQVLSQALEAQASDHVYAAALEAAGSFCQHLNGDHR